MVAELAKDAKDVAKNLHEKSVESMQDAWEKASDAAATLEQQLEAETDALKEMGKSAIDAAKKLEVPAEVKQVAAAVQETFSNCHYSEPENVYRKMQILGLNTQKPSMIKLQNFAES